MRNTFRFPLILIASVLPLLTQLQPAQSAEEKQIRTREIIEHYDADKSAIEVKGAVGQVQILDKSSVLVAEERFVDNGDGTVTDPKERIMWQKGDNRKEVTFGEAQQYCRALRLGGYSDWRLPNPEERDAAVVVELMMPKHSRDVYAHFDLYWSSDSTALLPFNYHPSYGKEVSRVYFAREGARAFVRAVRSLGSVKPDSGS